ncbi:hypothetical protein BpHYR1_008123, partial [Brachionus plicatilis]
YIEISFWKHKFKNRNNIVESCRINPNLIYPKFLGFEPISFMPYPLFNFNFFIYRTKMFGLFYASNKNFIFPENEKN